MSRVLGPLTIAVLVTSLTATAGAGQKAPPPPPALPLEHVQPTGGWAFRTPEGWTLTRPADRPETVEAWAGELGVRFVYRDGEAGYDSLHAACMLERLAAPMDTAPQVRYEYDFVSGAFGDRRA